MGRILESHGPRILVQNGQVVDGMGAAPRLANVGIRGAVIASLTGLGLRRANKSPKSGTWASALWRNRMSVDMTVKRTRERISERRIRTIVLRVLAESRLCSIATVARGNRAHINTAFFAYSADLALYFLSDPESLHSRNLQANPSLAMTIFDSSQRWERPGQGVQLFGTGRRTAGRQADLAATVYGTRFPAFGRWLKRSEEHTSELQSLTNLVCRLLLEKKN